MIYLPSNEAQAVVYVSKGRTEASGSLTMTLYSTVNRDECYEMGVADVTRYAAYWCLTLTEFATLPEGEYEYHLTDDDGELASGLAVKGDYHREKTNYSNTIKYEQYEG